MACEPPDHHRRSVRLSGYDYRWPGAYFMTICTHRHRCVLGQVVGEEILCSELDQIVARCWRDIPAHFDRASLGEFVVMPNHLHGIIILADDRRGTPWRAPTTESFASPVRGSIPTIVRSFKSAVTHLARQASLWGATPFWQRNYYEHVIRDAHEWERIAAYIASNPALWALDRLNGAAMEPLGAPAPSEDGLL